MTRGRVITVAILLLAAAALVTSFLYRPSDPTYKGLRLSEWLFVDGQGVSDAVYDASARDAIRHFGTNAFPILFRMLRAKDSFAERVWKSKMGIYLTEDQIHYDAGRAFEALGPTAAPAIPELLQIYHQQISLSSQTSALYALGCIGPDASSAIPLLTVCATNPSVEIRMLSVQSLGKIHSQTNIVVPVLTRALADPDNRIRSQAGIALENFGIKPP